MKRAFLVLAVSILTGCGVEEHFPLGSDEFGGRPSLADLGPDSDGDGIPDAIEPQEGTNANVKDNDVFQSVRLFVMQQYRDFLSREADPGGITTWTNEITSGRQARPDVVGSFLLSPEYETVIEPQARLYFATFLRIPDYNGLLFWIEHRRNGMTLEQIAEAFATSPEFIARYGHLNDEQYVTLLYQNILGRAPDAGGLQFWVQHLQTRSRGWVLLGFSESPEYGVRSFAKVFVTMVYVGLLRRSPDQAGFDFWMWQLEHGMTGRTMVEGFLGSPEYRARFLP